MSVRMNFEHELETLRENMDAMGKGIQQAFADLLSAIAFNNLEELDRIQKNDRKINEMERKIEAVTFPPDFLACNFIIHFLLKF